MAIFSPLRSRRFAQRQAEVTLHLIAFKLRLEWFALPITSVIKVISLGKVYGDPKKQGVAVTVYQDQELLVLDVGHRIFEDTISGNFSDLGEYLVITQNASGELIGIPINSPPVVRRVPQSACKSLPDKYKAHGNIKCVSDLVVEYGDQSLGDQPAMFLLNPELLKAN